MRITSELTRRLGASGPIVSNIGYGCMGISEFYGKVPERSAAVNLIRSAYLDHGVTFFDSADMYGKGLSEELLGEAVAPFRDQVIVATKCGIRRTDEGGIGSGFKGRIDNSREYIKMACAKSLEHLGMSHIDVYYLHRHDPAVPIEEVMDTMRELIEEGKIKWVGLSEVGEDIIRRAHAVLGDKLVAVQTEYSFGVRKAAEAVLPTCRELGISFVAYSPIVRGFLGGGYRDASLFGSDGAYDFRTVLPQFQKDSLPKNLRLVDAVAAIAKETGHTPAQYSLAWLLAQGDDVIPIPGTTNPKHLIENMAARSITLTKEELDALETAYAGNPLVGLRMPEAEIKALNLTA